MSVVTDILKEGALFFICAILCLGSVSSSNDELDKLTSYIERTGLPHELPAERNVETLGNYMMAKKEYCLMYTYKKWIKSDFPINTKDSIISHLLSITGWYKHFKSKRYWILYLLKRRNVICKNNVNQFWVLWWRIVFKTSSWNMEKCGSYSFANFYHIVLCYYLIITK